MIPRKTTILIIILAVVTSLLVFLAVRSEQSSPEREEPQQVLEQENKELAKTATIYFEPQSVSVLGPQVGTGSATTVDIMVNTGGTPITGLQIELSYDPKLLENVAVTPPLSIDTTSLFKSQYNTLFNEVDENLGRISYAIAIPQSSAPINGVGKIGTISFMRASGANTTSSQISFLDKTTVTIEDPTANILKSTTPLTIIVPNIQTSPAAQPITTP